MQPNVGGDLVITGSTGMQFFASIANELGEARFNIHVHIFALNLPVKFTARDFALDLIETAIDRCELVLAEHADLSQHVSVGA